jgi:hypothetical protein
MFPCRHMLVVVSLLAAAQGCSDDGAGPGGSPDASAVQQQDGAITAPEADGGAGPIECSTSIDTETGCADGVDEDCDGFTDCLDPDCEGQSCGDGAETCQAGGCIGQATLPELPRIDNVVPLVRGDTLIVEFSALENARDYRIYPLPDPEDVLVGTDGSFVVRDAIYRCGGDLARQRRDSSAFDVFGASIEGNVQNYMRSEAESLLGYVYLTPAAGREPVYRVGDPSRLAGYAWPAYVAPPGIHYSAGDYVVGTVARDALLADGWRDDGVAFYVPIDGKRMLRASDEMSALLFFVDGPEADARSASDDRFQILADEEPDSVPLHRIHYWMGAQYDVLAAGDANRERVLYQGNIPITSVTWPGIRGQTTFVIEALDHGCPFPGGFLGALAAPAADGLGTTADTILLEDARNPATGELFVNGQHEIDSRPQPIARAFVTVSPETHPAMDWFMAFDEPLGSLTSVYEDGNGVRILQNEQLSVEFVSAPVDYSYGIVLDQFAIGSSASFSLTARNAGSHLVQGDFLHATMAVDIASTGRRYPQIFITNAPADLEQYTNGAHTHTITARLGPWPFEMEAPGEYQSILVQMFGPRPELQVEFCDQRGWGVSQQCPRANIYGFHAGTELADWSEAWLPNPVMGELAGMDRPVKFDVYASTERVYVYIEDEPAGCAILPAGRMPAGDVAVVFASAGYHIDIDESVEQPGSQHQYWHRFSANHVERRFDDLGVDSEVPLPTTWDESRLPCGDRFYE